MTATINRSAAKQAFLRRVGWADATQNFLAGDASDRSYDRLIRGAHSAVLMDAPPGKGDDPAAFIAIARHLTAIGLSAPQIYAQDLTTGFLLIEDLGDDLYARLIASQPETEPALYIAAADVLAHLQSHPPAESLPNLAAEDWATAAAFVLDWYRFAITGDHIDSAPFINQLTAALTRHADGRCVMILRDFHAENLLWLPQRDGVQRVGLLDFQLAQMAQPGYDLVSLLQDARRDVARDVQDATLTHFIQQTGASDAAFRAAYAALGAQRALRILGIFARLCLQGGKAKYVGLIPRVWGQLQENLRHPTLQPLASLCHDLLPGPTPARLERIRTQCGTHPTP